MKSKVTPPSVNFAEILKSAVKDPGKIMAAYQAFHGYSFGNQLLAMVECDARNIEFGPIATFKAWQDKGRSVKKGEKAITLCMPVSFKKEVENEAGETVEKTGRFFTFKRAWFCLSQTEGDEIESTSPPTWDKSQALSTLEITQTEFKHGNGNVQGYAKAREVAINPLAQLPLKTLFHEIGHILLGHTDSSIHETPPRSLKEVEAESVALLCLAALGLDGQEYCRGYIQSWIEGEEIPEKSAKKIMSVADQILKAGTVKS